MSSSEGKLPQSTYPTSFSKWEWTEAHSCFYRYRLTGPGSEDVEYEYEQDSTIPRSSANPQSAYQEYPSYSSPDFSTYASTSGHQSVTPYASSTTYPSALQYSSPNLQYSAVPQYTSWDNYTNSSVDKITAAFGKSSLGSSSQTQTIRTSKPNTDVENVDRHYKVFHARYFEIGNVLKTFWSEPAGSGNGSIDDCQSSTRQGNNGPMFEKNRRFVVVSHRKGDGHCLCLPIYTYSGQGTTKYGVKASDHAIIYTEKPCIFPGEAEKGLTKTSIRVKPKDKRHKLDKASRINYAKVCTIEFNVKVWFIGNVHKDSLWQLITDYNQEHPLLSYPAHATSPAAYTMSGAQQSSMYPAVEQSQNIPPTGYAEEQYEQPYVEAAQEPLSCVSQDDKAESDKESRTSGKKKQKKKHHHRHK